MNALSRREEDTLVKATKARALKECDAVVKGADVHQARRAWAGIDWKCDVHVDFADCATGRTISVAWACRDKYAEVQRCMLQL